MSTQTNYIEEELLDLDNLVESKRPSFQKTNFFKLKEGSNRYRLLPNPNGGAPFEELYVHWFNFEIEKADGTVVKTYRTGLSPFGIEKKCALKDKQAELRAELTKLAAPYTEESLDAKGNKVTKTNYDKMPKEISDRYKALAGQAEKLKAQRHFYVNAVDESGTLGVLQMPKTAFDALKTEIAKMVNSGESKNPLSVGDAGLWFEFNRTGKTMRDTKYSVNVHMINVQAIVNGKERTVKELNRTPLSEDLKANYGSLGKDLKTLFKQLTYEDTVKIINGDYSVFDTRSSVARESSEAAPTQATASAAPAVSAASNVNSDIEFEEVSEGVDTIDLN